MTLYIILCPRCKIVYVNSKFSSVHNAWYCQKLISEGKNPTKEIRFLRSSLFFSYSCNFAPFGTWLFIIAGVTWSKFHIEDPKILETIFQNLVTRATWLLECVDSCIIFLTVFRHRVLSRTSRIQCKVFSKFATNFPPIMCPFLPFFILFI